MALGSLTARMLLALGSVASADQNWPDALRAADGEPDPATRARARVEVFYAAGDLPAALREALSALRAAPSDPVLLRRACQLETALRFPDLALEHSSRLARELKSSHVEPAQRAWWMDEAAALERGAQRIAERERALQTASRRARIISLAGLLLLLFSVLFLARGRGRHDG